MHDPQWKITGRQKESELHWLSLQMSVKDVPLWINRLVIGPMVGQTAALRLANRLASPLYYCVVKDTHIYMHTHTLSFHADLHTCTGEVMCFPCSKVNRPAKETVEACA